LSSIIITNKCYNPYGIIYIMGAESRKKRIQTLSVITEPENDGLRMLARIIARVHIQNKLNKVESQDINEENNNDSSNSFYSRTK